MEDKSVCLRRLRAESNGVGEVGKNQERTIVGKMCVKTGGNIMVA